MITIRLVCDNYVIHIPCLSLALCNTLAIPLPLRYHYVGITEEMHENVFLGDILKQSLNVRRNPLQTPFSLKINTPFLITQHSESGDYSGNISAIRHFTTLYNMPPPKKIKLPLHNVQEELNNFFWGGGIIQQFPCILLRIDFLQNLLLHVLLFLHHFVYILLR